MNIIFFGTGNFALATLKKLIESNHNLLAVVTQPDRKKGRGWKIARQPIKTFIQENRPEVPIFQPEKVSDNNFIENLKKIDSDIFIVVDYGQILAKEILQIPQKYCINLHPSLLPKYRGAAPIQRAVLAGENKTGNTIIVMNERMDAGDMIAQTEVKISETEDVEALSLRLSSEGADLMIKTLSEIANGKETRCAQNEQEATYAPKIKKEEGKIDWANPAEEINRKIKGLKPWPGAFTHLDGKVLKIFKAEVVDSEGKSHIPGTICSDKSFLVSAGDKNIRIIRLQLEGKKIMPAKEFLKGRNLKYGMVLG
ncbi:MAG: methionyl-tRNA formyltransferase [Candidatus Omnitrophica bacterium]|nr:methionyl-tRNA formyltransferase [Candidatus Omnitrophota bacterium]